MRVGVLRPALACCCFATLVMTSTSAAPVYTTLAAFTCFYGQCSPGLPVSGLVEVSRGTFFGSLTFGVLYTLTSEGEFRVANELPDAIFPDAQTPFHASDGNLYVPASSPGDGSYVYKYDLINPPYPFVVPAPVGASPLLQANADILLGTKVPSAGPSPIYSLDFEGNTEVLLSLPEQGYGSIHTLLQASDGFLYALTGLFTQVGTFSLIRVERGGDIRRLASFPAVNNTMIEASDGHFYGCAREPGAGSLYRLTRSGEYMTIYEFTGRADGGDPDGCGIQASDGRLYGTTRTGGAFDNGTIFQATLDGDVRTVYSFPLVNDAQHSSQYYARLMQASDGKLYGATTGPYANSPGEFIGGTIYSLDLQLPAPRPAITAFWPRTGGVGESVLIRGRYFLGATSVMFGTTPAAFVVKSANYIEATVPPGATTGFVTVTTPNGAATGRIMFGVR